VSHSRHETGAAPEPAAAPKSDGAAVERRRVLWVDYAKGWCVILVAMIHSALGVGVEIGATGRLHQVVAFAKPFRIPDF